MAVEIGTATDHVDLYNKLVDFLTGNADLVAAGQQWERVWGMGGRLGVYDDSKVFADTDVMLQGPGENGDDQVLVSLRLTASQSDDQACVYMRGHDGVVSSATDYASHVNTTPDYFVVPLMYGASMPYWFVANGRRFVCVIKCSTVYEACYGGLFVPYATPTQYPYPMAIGGSTRGRAIRWSDPDDGHRHFVDSYGGSGSNWGSDGTYGDTLVTRDPSGEWQGINRYIRSEGYMNALFPTRITAGFYSGQQQLIGGGHMLMPITLVGQRDGFSGTMGVLEGVFYVPGIGTAVEDIITVGGIDHLVVQNVFRTDYRDYWALALQ